MTPRATLRLQLNRDFTFGDAAGVVDYADRLGISHLYLSPILTARPGSMHGYDTIDHGAVSPELGGEEGLRHLMAALRRRGMGLIVDIVPNHMAADLRNRRWRELLASGREGAEADFFDVDWEAQRGKVLLPILGDRYETLLGRNAFALAEEAGAMVLRYGDNSLPLRAEDQDEARRLKQRATAEQLDTLLARQHYRLAWWRSAGDQINWRRFFDINELAAVRVERPEVFDAVHAVTLRLYGEGLLDGLRIDHIDGLTDPLGYCRRLRAELAAREDSRPADAPRGPAYLVVEKILGRGETLPPDWPVDGTTGYDFMNAVSALQHDPAGAAPLEALWQTLSGRPAFAEEEAQARRELLETTFAGQLEATVRAFHALAAQEPENREITPASLRRALTALLTAFPAYRTYATGEGAAPGDAALLARAEAAARPALGALDGAALDLVLGLLRRPRFERPAEAVAAARLQQLSAPLAAKAMEDTAFYRHARLLSRNDVGFDAESFAAEPARFHAFCAEQAKQHPAGMLATATHDHKRGEDLRARLAVLSELPALWAGQVGAWLQAQEAWRPPGLARADEYQLYQMLVGAWPPELTAEDAAGLEAFAERLAGWQRKALREAKLRSSWTDPDETYESEAESFLRRLLDPAASGAFLREVEAFVGHIAAAGAANGLAQALLRYTAPGVPDLYQGCDLWDFSLVDPDNRRPVDFAARAALLGGEPAALLPQWRDGAVKQAVIATLLDLRRQRPGLFVGAGYEPLTAEGPAAGQVVAFLRRDRDACLLVAALRLCAPLLAGAASPLPPTETWRDSTLTLPTDLRGARLRDVLGSGSLDGAGDSLPLALLFGRLPVAALLLEAP